MSCSIFRGSGNVRLVVPPREVEMHLELLPEQLANHGLQAADVLQTVNAAYHGTVAAQLYQADRSVPVAVRIAGVRSRPAGDRRARAQGARRRPHAAVLGGENHHGARPQPGRSPGRLAPSDRGGNAARSGPSRICRGRAQSHRRPGCAARGGVSALRRRSGSAGGSRAGAHAAFGGGVRADRAAARVGVRLVAPRAPGPASPCRAP